MTLLHGIISPLYVPASQLRPPSMVLWHQRAPVLQWQASAALLDTDGFYATGDVVQQESPTRMVWVDRKKNVLKLAQGEFVSLGRLEADYKGNSSLIHQV